MTTTTNITNLTPAVAQRVDQLATGTAKRTPKDGGAAKATGAGTAGEQVAAKISSLSAARKEQAELRKQAKANHPASADKPAAKKAPAKKAPVKAAPASAKLRWQITDKKTDAAVGTAGDVTYELMPSGGKWTCVRRQGKSVTTLADGVGRTAAYKVAVHHFKTGQVPA